LDGIQQRFFICVREFPSMVQRSGAAFRAPVFSFALPAFHPRPPVFVMPAGRSPLARSRVHAVRAYPVGVRKRRPLHSAFADRAVGKIGRQFSYKQNAEEGVRLDEKRRTMDRGTTGGWRRSYGVGSAWVCPRFREPFCGRYARSGAIGRHGSFSGRCVRIHMNCRASDLAPPARVAEFALAGRSADDRCVRIDRLSRQAAFPCLLHPDDIAAAHRDGRTTASECAAAHARVSRENERRRGMAR
jgi:hypothetical protein